MSIGGRGSLSSASSVSSPQRRSATSSEGSSSKIQHSTSSGRAGVSDAGGSRASTYLSCPSDEDRVDSLIAIGEPLAALPGRELIIARLLTDDTQLAEPRLR